VRRHCLRDRHVDRYSYRHPKLIEGQARVWGNDRASREVNSFAHKVVPDSAVFAFESFFNRFKRLTRLLFVLGLTSNTVVHERRHVKLNAHGQLIDRGLIASFVHLLSQEIIVLNDGLVAVS
jgi:hypothetical protein